MKLNVNFNYPMSIILNDFSFVYEDPPLDFDYQILNLQYDFFNQY